MWKRTLEWIAGWIALGLLVWAPPAAAWETTWVEGRAVDARTILIVPEARSDPALVAASLATRGLGSSIACRFDGTRVKPARLAAVSPGAVRVSHFVTGVPAGMPIAEALDRARGASGVRAADPNHLLRPAWVPNDPGYETYQDNFRQVFAAEAWEGSRGAGVTVAVIDTGYLLTGLTDGVQHLAPPSDRYDFADDDPDPTDEAGHGTHVTNTIAEATHNSLGVAGLAHNATILPLKIFPGGDDPRARESDLLDAVNWAVSRGAQVINMSLGGDGSSTAGEDVFAEASRHAFLVCASGNDGEELIDFPGGYDGCHPIGAVGIHEPGGEGVRSTFSNYGDELFLVAPGENVVQEAWSEDFGTGYFRAAGTSSAVPHVSAVAALMIARAGVLDLDRLEDVLAETAQDIGAAGWDNETGFGEVDAAAAVDAYAGAYGVPPVATIAFETQAAMRAVFTAAGSSDDGTIVSYAWDFGDGQRGAGIEAEHVYSTPGTYGVFLTVTDDAGLTDSEAAEVRVRLFGDGTGSNPFGCNTTGTRTGDEAGAYLLIAALLLFVVVIAVRLWKRKSAMNRRPGPVPRRG